MLERLRRRLQEATEDQWDDDTLRSYLLTGLHRSQQAIEAVRPDAFLRVDDTDIVSGVSDYTDAYIAKPQGFHHEVRVRKLDSTAESGYSDLEMISYFESRNRARGSTLAYCHFGRFFILSPTPRTSVTAGLRLEWVPTLSMAADSDVPEIPISLHELIVYYAEKVALGETAEGAELAEKEIQILLAQIPGFFQEGGANPIRIALQGLAR